MSLQRSGDLLWIHSVTCDVADKQGEPIKPRDLVTLRIPFQAQYLVLGLELWAYKILKLEMWQSLFTQIIKLRSRDTVKTLKGVEGKAQPNTCHPGRVTGGTGMPVLPVCCSDIDTCYIDSYQFVHSLKMKYCTKPDMVIVLTVQKHILQIITGINTLL